MEQDCPFKYLRDCRHRWRRKLAAFTRPLNVKGPAHALKSEGIMALAVMQLPGNMGVWKHLPLGVVKGALEVVLSKLLHDLEPL